MSRHSLYVALDTLKGETLESIDGLEVGSECAVFKTVSGRTIRMLHYQYCSEPVSIEDIAGDVADLIGSEILLAEEVSHDQVERNYEAWTFYKLATIKGYVTVRWYGTNSGYHSESVSIEEVK